VYIGYSTALQRGLEGTISAFFSGDLEGHECVKKKEELANNNDSN
jgi:hypothetical protein